MHRFDQQSLHFAAELHRRLFACLRLVKCSEVLWNCISVLVESPRPISESSLAEAIGCARTTVRQHIDKLIAEGRAYREKLGVAICGHCMQGARAFVSETLSIVMGTRVGYSRAVLVNLDPEVRSQAAGIQFLPALEVSVSA